MAEAQIASQPPHLLSRDDLSTVLYSLSDYIGVHEIEFDESGVPRDARLVWWNQAYEKIRTKKVEFGQSMMESYFHPQVALVHVNEAWNDGVSQQLFELSPATRDRYRTLGTRVVNLVHWHRVGDLIVEVGTDLREVMELREILSDQRSLIVKSIRQRDLAIERERIAQNLHDTVIQNLYAISLVLARAGREADEPASSAIELAVSNLEKVITGIRSEIFDLERRQPSVLRQRLDECLGSILTMSRCNLDMKVADVVVDEDILDHVGAVCGEAASNAVRHGRASHLWIDVSRDEGNLRVSIADDGIGIDPDAPLQNGLNNMRQRATSLGGTMQVKQRHGGGTEVLWSVPNPGWL